MKKWVFVVCFFCLLSSVRAQLSVNDFSRIDRAVQLVDADTPDSLAFRLTRLCQTDLEKVRAIFRWIAGNIRYKMKNGEPVVVVVPASYDPWYTDSSLSGKPAYESIAERVLQKRVAVCDGYARLFKTLCDYAGIRSEIISGYARTNGLRPPKKFRTNHTWNAVYLNGQWQLLDVTWATGFSISQTDEFVQQFNEHYFLTPPEEFIRDHFPEDIRWTLMTNPTAIAEYNRSPYLQKAFGKYGVEQFSPLRGKLEAMPGDTIRFEIVLNDFISGRNIAPDPFLDTTIFNHSPGTVFLYPELFNHNRIARYSFITGEDDVEWIQLVYNGDLMLRYRLQMKPRASVVYADAGN